MPANNPNTIISFAGFGIIRIIITMHWVFTFGNKQKEGRSCYSWRGPHAPGKVKEILGGKGAGLADMTNIGIPVPPGFTISTRACVFYLKKKEYPRGLLKEIEQGMKFIESVTGRKYGDRENPLLVSVRSGAKFSMPGMMDTVLNLGLNEETVLGLAKLTRNQRLAYDSYRRFIQMFGDIVLGMEHSDFEEILEGLKYGKGVRLDTELGSDDLVLLVGRYKEIVKKVKGIDFPQDPRMQLDMAIRAVFESWDNPRAITYRKLNNIPDNLGTAVNIQAMVFGNMGENSGTGVAFTRDPATGEKMFYGEYLLNAQGEDVVAGIRTPSPISKLQEEMPDVYGQLVDIYQGLETHYRDMQDIEFTIENGVLYMLQTRTGKRFPQAAVKIGVDMVKEGLISKEESLLRIEPSELDKLLHPRVDPEAKVKVIAKGLPASPGAVSGAVVFSSEDAIDWKEKGKDVIFTRFETRGQWITLDEAFTLPQRYLKTQDIILTRPETIPDDVGGMAASKGVLTARGGMTSHAAVVGRGMGKTCVVGCEAIKVDEKNKRFSVEITIKEGEYITLDGNTGRVIWGKAPTINIKDKAIEIFGHPRIEIKDKNEIEKRTLAKGRVTAPGTVCGVVAFNLEDASVFHKEGKNVVLLCNEITPVNLVTVLPMIQGVVTTKKEGATAHPTVAMKNIMDKSAIIGCDNIKIDEEKKEFTVENKNITIKQGEYITLDGYSGRIIQGQIPIVRKIDDEFLISLFETQIDPMSRPEEIKEIARGNVLSIGVVSGVIVFSIPDAINLNKEGKDVILVKNELKDSEEQISEAIKAVEGILIPKGGMITPSIQQIIKREGKCCIFDCEIKLNDKEFKAEITIEEGEFITLDGNSGRVILGQAPTIEPKMTEEFVELLEWSDSVSRLKVRANADTPENAMKAREFGAQGIGLCRTEHMFFGKDRLPIMQEMILAENKEKREEALNKLLPEQEKDFMGIFKVMDGFPVTIRLLDPPLHEFLPSLEEIRVFLAKEKARGVKDIEMIRKFEAIEEKIGTLSEVNPMLGFRGCRLGIIYPEIYDMQVKAIFEAATTLVKEGYKVIPEVMIPLVGYVEELRIVKKRVKEIAEDIIKKAGVELEYSIGTMIEVPRAALTADEIAKEAEFFSFGTNDLTQTVLAFSRDDAEKEFLFPYIEKKIFNVNPFMEIDRKGVGEMMKIGIEKGRKERKNLKIGICGEHGGNPASVEFCHQIGLDYVSCSPYRVPIARLAAAHAQLKFPME